MITIKNLTKQYEGECQSLTVLDDVSLNIHRGEVFGILGKSGAGKSTLLRCINGLVHPSSGSVFINGIDITNLTAKKLRRQRQNIGIIFQHFNLLNSQTVFDNIALSLRLQHRPSDYVQARVGQLLALVGLSDKSNSYPDQLSGGQKQRVAIARALVFEPSILLCDEATSALDAQATQSILKLLADINKQLGITVVLITHEIDVVKQLCDRVAVLHLGKLVECGEVHQVFVAPKHQETCALLRVDYQEALVTHQEVEGGGPTVRLSFAGQDSDRPLISQLIRQFDIDVNILAADITRIKNKTIGHTLCEFIGDSSKIKAGIDYIRSTSVQLEVLS